jgi:hypothetical protein
VVAPRWSPHGGRPTQIHHNKFIGNEFIHYIYLIYPIGQQSCRY